MPRYCTSCKYVTDDVWADGCPICLRPLALSPRPPTGGGPRPASRRRRRPLRIAVGVVLIAVPVVFLGLVFVTPEVFLGAEQEADSTGRIRAGMPVAAAAQELQIDPPPRAWSGTITRGERARLLRVRVEVGRVKSVEEGSVGVPVLDLLRVEADP
jgi:hypothetical protein